MPLLPPAAATTTPTTPSHFPCADLSPCSYRDLLSASLTACRKLEAAAAPGAAAASPAAADHGPRVALFADPGADYVAGQFGTWLHRGISVPLCLSHPDRQAGLVGLVGGQQAVPNCSLGVIGAPAWHTRLFAGAATSAL